jgi:hypothetical protein
VVFEVFEEQKLTPEKLRELSQHQVGFLASGFDALGVDPKVISRDCDVPLNAIGGFWRSGRRRPLDYERPSGSEGYGRITGGRC